MQYAKLSINELKAIVDRKSDYTELAVEVALALGKILRCPWKKFDPGPTAQKNTPHEVWGDPL